MAINFNPQVSFGRAMINLTSSLLYYNLQIATASTDLLAIIK